MMAVKRIMRYLKGTKVYGLYYKRNDKFELKVLTNLDWEGNIDEKKNTSGSAFFLEKRLVSWTRKKKNCISQSIFETKYVVATMNYSNIMLKS